MRVVTLWLCTAAVMGASCGYPDTGPIARDDTFEQVVVGEPERLDVLANDRAPAGQVLTIVAVRGAAGEASIVGRELWYEAPTDRSTDSFTYVVEAEDGSTATATISISTGLQPATTTTTTSGTTSTTTSGTTSTTTTSTTATSTSTTTTTTVSEPPVVAPGEVDFGAVTIGDGPETRTVTVTAGGEAWTPDWDEVRLVDGLTVNENDCGTLEPRAGCDIELTWSPTAVRQLDVTLRPHPETPLRILGATELAQPTWLEPIGDDLWFDELGRRLTVEVQPVAGADGYELTATLCRDGGCEYEFDPLEFGSPTRFALPPIEPRQLGELRLAFRESGREPVLRLTATAIAVRDDEIFESPPSEVVVTLVDEPFTATLVDHEPDENVESCWATLTVEVAVDWHLAANADVVAIFSDSSDSEQFVKSAPTRVGRSGSPFSFTADETGIEVDEIRLEVVDRPDATSLVDGVDPITPVFLCLA